jgi:hypothetical protein
MEEKSPKYERRSSFFKDFIEELKINASEFAKKLEVYPQYFRIFHFSLT